MRRGTDAAIIAFVLLVTTAAFVAAEPPGVLDQTWSVSASLDDYATVQLGPDIEVPYADGESMGWTTLDIRANFPYQINYQWLEGHAYDGGHETRVWLDGIAAENPPGHESGRLWVTINFAEPAGTPPSGSPGNLFHDTADVVVTGTENEWGGTVLLTLTRQP